MLLIPAYGRDYKSVKAVKEAFESGKDFLIRDNFSHDDGRYANKEDLVNAGIKEVKVRYDKLTKVTFLKL